MHLVYEENLPKRTSKKPFRAEEYDATKKYLAHYANSLTLLFFLEKGTRLERAQASKELAIAERKMEYWQRQSNFDRYAMIQGIIALKRSWR
jgi:hypothetical protein